MAGNISMGARREVVSVVAERYRSAGRREKGRILDELTAVTGWHRKHAVRALRAKPPTQAAETVPRKRRYNAAIRDAVKPARPPMPPTLTQMRCTNYSPLSAGRPSGHRPIVDRHGSESAD
jgi:hypothetical protein